MNCIADLQLLSQHLTFTHDKSLSGLESESWKEYLLKNLSFTSKECSQLVHGICAILVDTANLDDYIQFITSNDLNDKEFQLVLHICGRLTSNALLQILIEKCKNESDLCQVYKLVTSVGFKDIKSLIAKAKDFKLFNLGFEASLYYLSFDNDEQVCKDLLQIGLFNLNIMNLQVLQDLKLSSEKEIPLKNLLNHFKNGSKKDVEAWIQDDSTFKEFYDSNQLLRKVELYAFTNLCNQNVLKKISYQEISKVCGIPLSEVEKLIINGFRSNLVAGKMTQGLEFYVSKATPLLLEESIASQKLKTAIQDLKIELRSTQ